MVVGSVAVSKATDGEAALVWVEGVQEWVEYVAFLQELLEEYEAAILLGLGETCEE